MTFNVLSVLTGDEPETFLYPVPADSTNTVEKLEGDGKTESYAVNTIEVVHVSQSGPKSLAKFADVSAHLFLTDRRTILACSNYDKGGGYSGWSAGGLAVATVANAVSKAKAKKRREGKMLVGHIQHDWLAKIEAKDRQGFGSKNVLMLMLIDPTAHDRLLSLNLTLSKELHATEVANELNRRANIFRSIHSSDQDRRISSDLMNTESKSEKSDTGVVRYIWL